MISTISSLNALLPFSYLIVFSIYTYDFFAEKNLFSNSKRIFLFITLFVHAFYLMVRSVEFNHPPITTKFEIFSLLAFSVSFSYFILELLTDIHRTGSFIILFSLVFQIISSLSIEHNYVVPEVLRNRMLGLHVVSAILGYSGFTISAVYGLLFLILYKNLRNNKFGLIFNRLPSLEILEKLSFYSLVIGFILLTIAIIIGTIWLPSAFPNFRFYDPKLVGTAFIWIAYGTGIISKYLANWYGKKVIIFSLCGFILTIISLIITSTYSNTFHSFY
ncbi:MAG: cytochrome c biogenesis protein CcsA [Melioribacter sp.]|uniref:cytochrome C assembly family protein n=1 Tax=Rosettibacter primus TaxID=3111523 RepID=UPI00247B6433|nr:cytochrome c biogenesis protein CcsA [Melioribacter sp.]